MQREFEGQVNFIGVAGRDDLADMKNFVAEYSVGGFEHIADDEGRIWSEYGVSSQPAFAFIDDSGQVDTIISRLGIDRLREKTAELTTN